MNSDIQFIFNCQDKVFNKQSLSENEVKELLNTSKSELKTLSDSANKITRKFQGDTIDVEQLSNIKKIIAAKIVHFVGNPYFLIQACDQHQLLSKEEVVKQAKKAYDEGAQSYCLVAAWREPTVLISKKCVILLRKLMIKWG